MHVILVVDYVSQYFVVNNIGGVTTMLIIQFVEDKIMWWYRVPNHLVMDQGLVFMSREF